MTTQPVCAIVGVGPGLGMAVARRFGREGFRLALLARRPEALEAYQKELAQEGLQATSFAVNAGDVADVQRAFAEVEQRLGAPRVLVYNAAAMGQYQTPSQLEPLQLVEDFRVNVAGALAAARAVLPAMRSRREGTLLFTGGGLALDPYPQMASLAVGKAGIRSIAQSLAKELRPEGIHVATVTICGMIKPGTPFAAETVAERYWALHQQPPASWQVEDVVR